MEPQATTLPPTPPSPPGIPDGGVPANLGRIIQGAVAEGLSSAQSGLEQALEQATAARDLIQQQLDNATSPRERSSLTRQLTAANRRVADIRNGIEKLKGGQDRLNIPGTFSETRPPQNINDMVPTTMIVSVMSILFIGFPLAIAFARIMLKRANNAPIQSSAQLTVEQTRRFDRLEQSVDAIAIEVERISEGQRYLTKVLGEGRPSAPIASGPGSGT